MQRTIAAFGIAICLAACATSSERAHSTIAGQARALLETAYPADGPGGAVLIARGDRILFRAARGQADIETHTPLQPDSVFRIGSITKQFTAAGVLSLVEAGRVGLDDPLSRYLPDYPGGENISVRQLLNHTSGVRTFSNLPGYTASTIRQDFTTAQTIALFSNEPPQFAPGSNWDYSNSGYALAAAIIETVTGMPWHEYLRRTFFEPLGMRHTGYGHDPAFARQQVHGYAYDGGAAVPALPMSMTQPHGAGALVSTLDDLLIWNRALHEGRILGSEAYTQMITPSGAAVEARYGFGVEQETIRGQQALAHGGHIFGFMAKLIYIPGSDITVVVLENDDARNGASDVDALARRFAAIALEAPYPALAPIAVDAATLAQAEGVYRFDSGATRILRVVDGALTAQREPGARRVLTPIAAGDFLYDDGFTRIRLDRDANGAITGARFFPAGDGEGDQGARTNEPLPPLPIAVELPPGAIERLLGEYANAEVSFRVFLEGGVLKVQVPGQPALALIASSPTHFQVAEEDATVEFSAGDTPAREVTIRQGGRDTVLQRTP